MRFIKMIINLSIKHFKIIININQNLQNQFKILINCIKTINISLYLHQSIDDNRNLL